MTDIVEFLNGKAEAAEASGRSDDADRFFEVLGYINWLEGRLVDLGQSAHDIVAAIADIEAERAAMATPAVNSPSRPAPSPPTLLPPV